jgi:hypothetical protein
MEYQSFCAIVLYASSLPLSRANWLPLSVFLLQLQRRFRLLSIYQRFEEILFKKIMVAKECFLNYHNFNPI